MKANKRVRDLRRRSLTRLYTIASGGVERGTTTFPYGRIEWKGLEGIQKPNGVKTAPSWRFE